MSTGKFKVLRASAGSGKTYALVREYLLLALNSDDSYDFRGILALTFTNAAASEMKERVLKWLQEFSKETQSSELATDLCKTLGIEPLRLQVRAEACYRRMLHNYSQLGIMTIDKFVLRIVKAFARELNLSFDFAVEIDDDRLIEEVVERCMELIGIDEEITEYIEDFALDNLKEGGRWDIRTTLKEKAKTIVEDDTRVALEKLGDIRRTDFIQARKRIAAHLNKTTEALRDIQKRYDILRTNIGFSTDELSWKGGSYLTYMDNLEDNWSQTKPYGARFLDFATKESWLGKGKKSPNLAEIEAFREHVQALMAEVIELLTPELMANARLLKRVSASLPALGLLKDLQLIAEQIKKEDNYRLVSDFHQMIHDQIQGIEAPYLYERIGVRYKHILIDEFQDTSTLQWQNLLPLVVNSLSEENTSLLVGDAKQSIYRWRGAQVDQFIHLPEIKGIRGFSPDVLRHHFKEEILPTNFRSAKNIVEFNNRLFSALSTHLGEYQVVYKDIAQNVHRKSDGYVRIERIPGDKTNKTTPLIIRITAIVGDCMAAGFRPCDIAILTRKGNKEAGKIAVALMDAGYKVVTPASLLIYHSPAVRALMFWLEYTVRPNATQSGVQLLLALREIHPQLDTDNFLELNMEKLRKGDSIPVVEFLGTHLNPELADWKHQQALLMAADFIRKSKLPADSALEMLMQIIREHTIDKQRSLSEFIEWWHEAKENLYSPSIEDEDSVKIQTIHKSKGLQYPVVIYPRFSSKDQASDIWIDTDPELCGITTAQIPTNIKDGDLTFASAEINLEKSKDNLDQTNVAYVAATRAEERLYVLVESGAGSSAGEIFDQTIDEAFPVDDNTGCFSLGTEAPYEPETNKLISVKPGANIGEGNPAKLQLITGGIEQTEQKIYGEFLHACLAAIRKPAEIREVAERLKKTQALTTLPLEKAISDITELFHNPQVAEWFQPGIKTYIEKDCIIADGSLIRPDRVVVMTDHIAVIDYKSGDPHPAQALQIQHYIKALTPFFDKTIRGFIVYTSTKKILEVYA